MCSSSFDVKKLFKSSTNQPLDEVIQKGLRRTTKAFDDRTEMSQSTIMAKVADSVDLIAEIAKDVEKDKKKFDPLRLFEQEMGVRFSKRRNDKTRSRIEANADVFEEDDVESIVYKGIVFAILDSQNPTGRFDQILLSRIELLKNLKNYYQRGDLSDCDTESDDGEEEEEGTDEEQGQTDEGGKTTSARQK